MTAEITYLLEEQTRKLENAEMLIERLKREVMALSFSVALHDRAAEKARAIWAEAHPDEAEEWLCREDLMVWMIERVKRAEAVKESLKSALLKIRGVAWENVWNVATDALISLRTTEDSSVVDSTPAKQPEDSENADEDVESLIDDGGDGMTHTPGKKAKLHTQWPAHVRDEGGGGIYLVAGNGRYIAHFFEPKRRNVYNALRIAALWNMAERLGLSTEEIDGITDSVSLHYLSLEIMAKERGDSK